MAEVRFRQYEVQPPRLKQVLLVDDNDRYSAVFTAHLKDMGAEVTRVRSAAEGVEQLMKAGESYDGVITDISMEGQLSGMKVIRAAKKSAFNGILTVATTGLDNRFGFTLNRFFLGMMMKCDYLIPKRPIKKDGKIIWIKGRELI